MVVLQLLINLSRDFSLPQICFSLSPTFSSTNSPTFLPQTRYNVPTQRRADFLPPHLSASLLLLHFLNDQDAKLRLVAMKR